MEFVLVVKRYELFDRCFPHGFVAAESSDEVATYLERIRTRGFFLERRRAELDSSFKQIIPYAVVTSPKGVFLLRRFSSQSEARLHDKLSIGVGGHLNPEDGAASDGTPHDVLEAGLARELLEELHVDGPWSAEPVGVINDESNDVGSVHFGIVYRVEVPHGRVVVRESDKMEGRFVARRDLAQIHDAERARFESWSDLILARVDAVLDRPVAAQA